MLGRFNSNGGQVKFVGTHDKIPKSSDLYFWYDFIVQKSSSVVVWSNEFAVILPVQISAARVLLGISQKELAASAAVSLGTVKRIEAARDEITGTAQTIDRIQRALEAAGIMFIAQDGSGGPGVRLRDHLP